MPLRLPTRAGSARRETATMTPEAAYSAAAASFAWRDAAALAMLFVMSVALIFPAIYGSRFQARLAACQNGLRRFGLALTEYSQRHGDALSRLADNGRLTDAGAFAVGRLDDESAAGDRQAVCPQVWLAAQDKLQPASGVNPAWIPRRRLADVVMQRLDGPLGVERQSRNADDFVNNWPGTWRNGTTNDRQAQDSPATLPLLADAPSADVPGHIVNGHEGRGRNVFFADGQIRFLPCSSSDDATVTPLFASPDGLPRSP